MVKVKYPVRARILSPIVALGVLGIFALGATPAYAHDQLVGSSPADRTSLATAPKQITLFFEEPPAAGFTALVVIAPDGSRVDSGSPVIRGATLMTTLHALTANGHYTVTFRIMSDDGHPVAGTLGFTLTMTAGKPTPAASNFSVAQPSAPPPPPPPAAASADSKSSAAMWLPVGVVAAAVLSAAGALAARRSRSRASGTTG